MKRLFLAILATLSIGFISFLEAHTMETVSLHVKQQSIIEISAFTAKGDLEKLKHALNQGLDHGLSINEIKEALIQLYAYTGFPRSLNALGTFKTVLDERAQKGINDVMGKEATPLPSSLNKDEYGAHVRAELMGQKEIPAPSGYQLFAPTIDTFLKEHLFADIFARDVLEYKTRELVTISALSSMEGTAPQLQAHLAICLNVGWSQKELEAFIAVLETKVGVKEAHNAQTVLTIVLKNRK